MSATIRRAVAGDADPLGAVLSGWIDETPWMPRIRSREDDRNFVAGLIASTEVLALIDGDRASGFLARDGEEITAFYLCGTSRRRGHGSAMMSRAMAGSEQLSLWTFQANTDAIRFYERVGFVQTKWTDNDNEEGLPDVLMTWARKVRQ